MIRKILVAIIVLSVLSSAVCLTSCRDGYSEPPDSIIVGIMANAGDTLIFVAEEQKYFADNGLNVTLKTYDNGLDATNAMLGGEADLSYATEFVVVGKALQNQRISMVTTYSKNETVSLVGRKDRGIDDIPDLKGKTM